MTQELRTAYLAELSRAMSAREAGDVQLAFHHLSRAHILGQRSTLQHVRVHWRMLQLGLFTRDIREVWGQFTRIFAAAVFSRIWLPVGNTGRSNVSAFQPMPIPEDLRPLLEKSDDPVR